MSVNTKLIPRNIIFGNPSKTMGRISPDGTRLSYLAPKDGVLNIWVGPIGSDEFKVVTNDADRGIRNYFWASDNTHLLYLQDVGGNENWRLYAVNLESAQTRDLTPFENVQVQIVSQNKHFPDELLIGLNKENPQFHDVYHLQLSTGELKMVAKNPGNVADWVVDADFKVRGAWTVTPDGGFNLLVRDTEEAEWQQKGYWDADNTLNSGPVAFTKDGKGLYLIDSRNYNAGRLVKLDIASEKLSVIAADPHYDVGGVMIHPDTYVVQAVAFVRARSEWTILDDSIRGDIERLAALERGDLQIVSRDEADKTWLAVYSNDNRPVSYYAYDRSSGKATFLFYNQPELEDYSLATADPISFTARDGLTVHGYISFPPEVERKNLPLVLLVHGGPWARDSWGLHPEAQWLTNRGYICLRVNFRGSTGYGKDFVNAGDKEWGAKMQDDLTDAVNWAVEQGYADPKKVAIYGGSYGGYAALAGATFTPDLYCCAVDMVGPSNLLTLIASIPPYWETFRKVLLKRVGDPATEEDFLVSRSPLTWVDRIKIPMLIAQGANDPRVKQAEAEQIVAAMQAKGIKYEYMLFPDEGHGLAKPQNRFKFYATMEKFLADNLGGRYED